MVGDVFFKNQNDYQNTNSKYFTNPVDAVYNSIGYKNHQVLEVTMKFKCACCDEVIEGIPTFGWSYPLHYLNVPQERRNKDVFLTEDLCVIEDKWFYIRGCLEIPVIGHEDPFVWGVWVSLSEQNFFEYQELIGEEKRSQFGPYFGWLAAHIRMYPETENLKTLVHVRDKGVRPYLEVEQNGHPLACEQQNGVTLDRVAEIYACMVHEKCPELREWKSEH